MTVALEEGEAGENRGRRVISEPPRSQSADSSISDSSSPEQGNTFLLFNPPPLYSVMNPGRLTHLLRSSFLMRSNSDVLKLECQPIFREHTLTHHARRGLAEMEDKRAPGGTELHLWSLFPFV